MDNRAYEVRKTISIVIPALNERDGTAKTIEAVPERQLESMGYEVQILVVDNGSNDGTGELARRAEAEVVFEPRREIKGIIKKTGCRLFQHS